MGDKEVENIWNTMPCGIQRPVLQVWTQLSGSSRNKVASLKAKPRWHDSLLDNPVPLLGDSSGIQRQCISTSFTIRVWTLERRERQPHLELADHLTHRRLALPVSWVENPMCANRTCEVQETGQGALPVRLIRPQVHFGRHAPKRQKEGLIISQSYHSSTTRDKKWSCNSKWHVWLYGYLSLVHYLGQWLW